MDGQILVGGFILVLLGGLAYNLMDYALMSIEPEFCEQEIEIDESTIPEEFKDKEE